MNDDKRYEAWGVEFDHLYRWVNLLHARTQMWEAIDSELVRTQRPGSGIVVEVFRPMVGESQGVLVRRLLDDDKRSRSIVRLVGQMCEHNKVLTRDRFVGQWQPDMLDEANQSFDQLAGLPGKKHIPRRVLLQFREAIVKAGEEVIESVNQIVAHDQREKTAQPFTWGLLKQSIEHLSVQTVKVGKLLRGGTYYEPVPYLAPEWQEPFKDGLFGAGAPDYQTQHLIERQSD